MAKLVSMRTRLLDAIEMVHTAHAKKTLAEYRSSFQASWRSIHKLLNRMCPSCSKWEQEDVADGKWRCCCGARGFYKDGRPVAQESDAMRLNTMCDKLLDTMAASSDRDRVKVLAECLISLRKYDPWFMTKGRQWCNDHAKFDATLSDIEDVLAALP